MTRKEVAVEGKILQGGRLIEKDAIYVQEDRVPVTVNSDWESVVGYATDLQRDGDTVTMEITVHPSWRRYVELKKFDATVFLAPVEYISDPSRKLSMIVTKGRLRGVTLIDKLGPVVSMDFHKENE